jgi:hypothetical protein
MTKTQVAVFGAALLFPPLYQRSMFAIFYKRFLKPFMREKSGLQIHHGHWGIVLLFISSVGMMVLEQNSILIAGLGLGWGLLLDEFIPSLMMPTVGRKIELEVYEKALKPTLVLFGLLEAVVLIQFAFSTRW